MAIQLHMTDIRINMWLVIVALLVVGAGWLWLAVESMANYKAFVDAVVEGESAGVILQRFDAYSKTLLNSGGVLMTLTTIFGGALIKLLDEKPNGADAPGVPLAAHQSTQESLQKSHEIIDLLVKQKHAQSMRKR